MKLLKIPLADGKKYTIQTFTLLQKSVMKKEYAKYGDFQVQIDKILYELDEKGNFKKNEEGKRVYRGDENITEKEKVEIEKIQEVVMKFGIDVLRKCLSTHHPDFKKNEDIEKEQAIHEIAMGLVDEHDVHNIISFAFNGIYVREENVIDISIPNVGLDDLVDAEPKKE